MGLFSTLTLPTTAVIARTSALGFPAGKYPFKEHFDPLFSSLVSQLDYIIAWPNMVQKKKKKAILQHDKEREEEMIKGLILLFSH